MTPESSITSALIQSLSLTNCFAALAVYYILSLLYSIFFHPLRRVPGPFLARFSELWRNIRYFRGSWLDDVVSLHEKYGPVVRIAPNEISLVDGDALKQLYGHGKPSQKTPWYNTWVIPGMADSFFATLDQKIHRTVRSRVSGTYSMTAILGMESLISDVMTSNIRKLRDVSRRGPVSIDEWVNYFTFDVVGQLSMGGPIGFLDQEQDVNGIIRSIHDGFYLMANFGYIPLQTFWFNNSFSRYLIRNFGGRRLNSFETFVGWLDKRVTKRMEEGPGSSHNDMLQYFINGKMPNGEPVGKGEVMIEGINILGAGADTTAVAILAVLGAIMTHEGAYEKLQKDVDAAYESAGLQANADGELSFHDAERIPYLSAVVRESMRLHPSITYQLPRVPPPEGLKIGDYYIPSSATCGISPAAMNRDTTIFGPDAARWVPERWIPSKEGEDEAKRLRVMEQNLTTFGMGSRSCIGRNLALVETYKYIAGFVRHFNAELVRPDQPWTTKSQWFAFPRDFHIRMTEREF